MRLYLFLILSATAVFAQAGNPLAERLAAQNALFEEQYQGDLRSLPERAKQPPGLAIQPSYSLDEA